MREERPVNRGSARRGSAPARGSRGEVPRGAPRPQAGAPRSAPARAPISAPARAASQPPKGRGQASGGHSKAPEASVAGVQVPKPALRIGTAVLLLAIATAVVIGLARNAALNAIKPGTITSGVKIDGRDVSGMNVDQLDRQLREKYRERIANVSVEIDYNGKSFTTLHGGDIGMTDDADEIVGEAAILARTGSAESMRAEARQIRASGRGFTVTTSVDEKTLRIKLTEVASSVSKPGQDAMVSFNPAAADFTDPDDPPQAELDKIPSMFRVSPEKAGQTVDIDSMEQQILEALKTSDQCRVDMAVAAFTPKLTAEKLRQTFHELAVFSTHISGASPQERVSNIKLAISKFNGIVLNPGQELSFNDTTGARTAANGYQMAHVINKNQYVDDYGGGVCQASTTLYNAALLAGLKITDSGPHSIPSDYVNKGFDAMVDYASKSDLKFVNPYDTPVYLKTFVTKKNNVYVMFFGEPLPDEESITLENDIIFKGPTPDSDLVEDDGTYSDFVTYVDQQYTAMLPHPELRVVTYRVYRDSSGKEIRREKLREDHYGEIRGLIVYGRQQRPEDSAQPAATGSKSKG